jgi:hypothetical protein
MSTPHQITFTKVRPAVLFRPNQTTRIFPNRRNLASTVVTFKPLTPWKTKIFETHAASMTKQCHPLLFLHLDAACIAHRPM